MTKTEIDKAILHAAYDALARLPSVDTEDIYEEGMRDILLAFKAAKEIADANKKDDAGQWVHPDIHHIVASALMTKVMEWDINEVIPNLLVSCSYIQFALASRALQAASDLSSVAECGLYGEEATEIALKLSDCAKV